MTLLKLSMTKRIKLYFLATTILLVISPVVADRLSQMESVENSVLMAYINNKNNGVKRECESNGINYSLKYKPQDLIVQQDLEGHPRFNKDSLRAFYSDCKYFVLAISYEGKEIFSARSKAFESMLKEVSFGLKEDIFLEENETGELFYLTGFIYPRLYGVTPFTSILLCFKDKRLKTIGDFTLYVKDFLNGSAQNLKFEFSKKDIDRIPTLKM